VIAVESIWTSSRRRGTCHSVEFIPALMSLSSTSSRVFRFASKKCIFSPLLQVGRNIYTAANAAHREELDVVIVGGGPAGLALASALGMLSTRVVA
jgi:NADPH-dependent 2,4-dienoyl-CoA reductase/sulfur reductase-like enzyme